MLALFDDEDNLTAVLVKTDCEDFGTYHAQGKRDLAHTLLSAVYQKFTKGFDTADLVEARVLIALLPAGCRVQTRPPGSVA